MKKINYLSLDGHALMAFLEVLNEASVTRASARLGVTQSAVSHTLDKLRAVTGDPLFVRSGRGIAATEKALALKEPVQNILDALKGLTDERIFDPLVEEIDYTIAANDFQRDLIFPKLVADLQKSDINPKLRFIPSGIPSAGLLRNARCDFIITPFCPQGRDIYRVRLFDDPLVCFYDPIQRGAPKGRKEFFSSKLIEVRFPDGQSDVAALAKFNLVDLPKASISVPSFNAAASFLQGSDRLCVAIRTMQKQAFRDFEFTKLPFTTKNITVYLVWHHRNHNDPAHKWLREKIKQTTATVLGKALIGP